MASGYNDITLRSQQFGAEVTAAADARAQRSQEVIGQSVQNLGQNIQQTVWKNREMNFAQQRLQQDQMQFDQELANRQQQFQMGFQLQKAQADMQLQLSAQEQQMNLYKLQQMAAIDAVDMSQIQKERAKMENRMMELGIKQQERQMDEMAGIGRETKIANMIGQLNPYYLTSIGYKVDPQSGKIIPFKDEQEKQQTLQDLQMSRYGSRLGVDPSMAERRDMMSFIGIQTQIGNIDKMLTDMESGIMLTPEKRAQLEQERQYLVGLRNQIVPEQSGQDKSAAKAAPAPEQPQAAKPIDPREYSTPVGGNPVPYSPADKTRIEGWSRVIGLTQDDQNLLDAGTSYRISKFIYDNQDRLYDAYKKGAAQGREDKVLDKDTFLQNSVNSLGSTPSPYRMNLLMVLFRAGVITQEEAQLMSR